jgi:hypothetical protein
MTSVPALPQRSPTTRHPPGQLTYSPLRTLRRKITLGASPWRWATKLIDMRGGAIGNRSRRMMNVRKSLGTTDEGPSAFRRLRTLSRAPSAKPARRSSFALRSQRVKVICPRIAGLMEPLKTPLSGGRSRYAKDSIGYSRKPMPGSLRVKLNSSKMIPCRANLR